MAITIRLPLVAQPGRRPPRAGPELVVNTAPPTRHVFVDETKQRGYVLVAAAQLVGDLDQARRALRDLVLPGQRRIHMKKESDPRRRAIANVISQIGVEATIYDAGRRYGKELVAREACFEMLVADQPVAASTLLVIEQDDSVLRWDRRNLYRVTKATAAPVSYEHRRALDEPLLAVPDAIAWCWAKGGDWRRRVEPVIAGRRVV